MTLQHDDSAPAASSFGWKTKKTLLKDPPPKPIRAPDFSAVKRKSITNA
jgi:hypothetical protein